MLSLEEIHKEAWYSKNEDGAQRAWQDERDQEALQNQIHEEWLRMKKREAKAQAAWEEDQPWYSQAQEQTQRHNLAGGVTWQEAARQKEEEKQAQAAWLGEQAQAMEAELKDLNQAALQLHAMKVEVDEQTEAQEDRDQKALQKDWLRMKRNEVAAQKA